MSAACDRVESGTPYLTPREVAQMLQVSEKSIYRWTKDDPTMPALRIGGTLRFPRERLEKWLRDREQGRRRSREHPISNQVLSLVKSSS